MKQLGILDSAFINLEQPNTPQHVGGIAFYDPSTAPGGFVRFKQVIANFEQRLLRMPLFRTRLVEVPGGVDKPYWVLDANFDVEFHLRHIALPKPGDWRQLCIQVARLHARPLDMTRPLWEAYIIEGLDNIPSLPKGSFAVYTKMHHSLVDGAGSQSFMAALHDLQPVPEETPLPDTQEALLVDRDPSSLELLTRAAMNKARGSVELATGTASVVKGLADMGLGIMRDELPKPDVQAPKTRFNEPVSKHRVFEGVEFDLDDLKEIKDAARVKLNDVALNIVAGAMRKYLLEQEELPEASLAVSIPLNMRTRRDETEDNNQVGSVFCDLHTDVADPIDRLGLIHETTQGAKVMGEVSPMTDTLKLAGVFSPWLAKGAARFYSKNELSRRMPLNISSVVTNVAGPSFDLYCAGARMVRYYGLGVLTPGCGLFHTVFSSNGVLTISVLADRDQMPDPGFYRECIEASFAELQRAVRGEPKPAKKPRTSARAPEKAAAKRATGATKGAPKKKAAASTAAASTAAASATAASATAASATAASTKAVSAKAAPAKPTAAKAAPAKKQAPAAAKSAASPAADKAGSGKAATATAKPKKAAAVAEKS